MIYKCFNRIKEDMEEIAVLEIAPTNYNCFFNCNLCHVCKEKNFLSRCSSCRTTVYCCRNHQKSDWKHHKEICSAIAKTNRLLNCFSVVSYEDFVNRKILSFELWKKHLNRDLYPHEMQMWMFPRVCEVCFSSEVKTKCQNCHNTCYCTEAHQTSHYEEHQKHCPELKLSLEMDLEYYRGKHECCDIVVSDFNDSLKVLPKTLQNLMQLYDKTYPSDEDQKVNMIKKSDLLSSIATILYGMETSGYLSNRIYPKEDLTVHIVGASDTELKLGWIMMSELPFHWITNLKSLEYILIGPELACNKTIEEHTEHFCDKCQSKNVKAQTSFHSQVYHKIVKFLKPPDVVVAFNCGLHEYVGDPERNSWDKSIPSLLHYPGVPLILTAYTSEELDKDLVLVKKNVGCVVRSEPHRNPFSNARPLKNFDSQKEPVYYCNGYIAVLSKC